MNHSRPRTGWMAGFALAALITLPVGKAGADSAAAPATAQWTSTAKGNIFTANHGEMTLGLSGTIPVTGGTVTLKNEQGNVIRQQSLDVSALPFKLPLEGKGFYQIEADLALASGTSIRAETTAAVVGPLLDDAVRYQSRLGLWTVQGDPDLVLAAGARWNRAMTTIKDLPEDFAHAEPTPAPAGKKPFDISGFTYEGVFSFGLPLWMLQSVPEGHKGFSNPFQAPKDWNALSDLMKAYVKHPPRWSEFPPYVEIYNEPEWHWKGTNEDLVRFEATMADAIKAVRPDVKVLGPGFSSVRIKDPARIDLETLNRLGLFDHLDGLVLHAYVDGSAPEDLFIQRIQELQDFLSRIGRPDFPIHLTEFGWCTKPGTWQKPVDELTQARYVVRSLTLLAALGVENATYFALLFKAAPNEGERSFSIVHNDLTPKPAFAAYSNVARWLADIRGKGRWLHVTPDTHLVVFEKANQTAAVAWNTKASTPLPLADMTARAEDMTGRPLALGTSAGLTVSPSPVFLELKNSGLYHLKTLPAVRLMRGSSVAVPAPLGSKWLTPAPLAITGQAVTAPRDAQQGAYLLLSQADDHWTSQPVDVVAPVKVSAPQITWPLSANEPRISLNVESYSETPLKVLACAQIEKSRAIFSNSVEIAAAAKQTLDLPLGNLVPGNRYRGTVTVESRENGERDQTQAPLDITVATAQRLAPNGSPDWKAIPEMDFTSWEPFGGTFDKANCSATFQAAYGVRALYLRIRVRDDAHVQTAAPEMLFSQDSLQIGLDADAEKTWEANDLFGLKGHRVFEYGAALNGEKAVNWRWISYTPELPVGVAEPRMGTEIHRESDITEYTLTFPWDILGLKQAPQPGTALGIALVVNDTDPGKPGRHGLRLFNGVNEDKDPQRYGKLWLR